MVCVSEIAKSMLNNIFKQLHYMNPVVFTSQQWVPEPL